MAEDTHDQGTFSALRPRPGWDKAAQNPDVVHSTLDLTAIAGTGYMDPLYQPPKLSPHSDAGEFDQSPFKETQQGHRLGRASSPNGTRGGGGGGSSVRGPGSHAASEGTAAVPDLEGAPRADGRPAWDSRFVLERSAWEVQPRTALLRPPSTNAFPGSGVRSSFPTGTGRSDRSRSPGGRRTSDGDNTLVSRTGGNRIVSTDGNGTRTTILPGLNAASPPIWASPYGGEATSPGPGRSATSPGSSPGPAGYTGTAAVTGTATGAPAAAAGGTTGAQRPPRTELLDSYVGRAYSPDQSYFRESSAGSGSSPGRGGAGDAGGATTEGGGVDGHGTHLPALERAGYARVKEKEAKESEKGARAAAAAKASAQKAAILALGAVYLRPGTKLRIGGSSSGGSGASARGMSRSNHQVASPPPVYGRSCRSIDDDCGRRAHSYEAGGYGGGGHATDRGRDTSPGPCGGIWRPSGRQPIPEAAPPVPKHTPIISSSGEAKETQEEADRRRAVPRDPSIYSPERYPIVGMGWFMPPEKIPPNPAYAGIKAKYLEARPPRPDDDGAKTPHMPDIHLKPWLTPGKHLVTDSSTTPPKMTGTAGARPPYSFSPSATGTSVAGAGTSRSNRGTARSGRGAGRGGGGSGKRNGRRSRSSSSASESDSDAEGSDVDGEREVLTVIGGVRLMSMTKRRDMQDEAQLEAEEDAQMAKEDAEAAEAAQRGKQEQKEEQQQQPEREDTGTGEEQETLYSSGLEASGSRTRAGGEREGSDDGGGPGSGVSGKPRARAMEAEASGNASNGKSPSSSNSCKGESVQAEEQRGDGFGPEAGADAETGDGDDDYVASQVPAVREVSRRNEGDEDEAEAEAGGLRGDQEEPGGGGYEEADDADDGDEDDDDVAAAAAMAGLGDGDGDGDVDAGAADGGDEEAEVEELAGDNWN